MKKEILQFEYKNVSDSSDENLNKLGKQGWEAVSEERGYSLLKRPCGVITMDLPEFVVKKDISSYER